MKDIYQILKKLNINYEKYEHPPVYTVEEAQKHDLGINAGKSKNLFLRNKKGNNHYLVIVESTKKTDLKKLADILNDDRLSFASPERLLEYLELTPGSVSPFGIINDKNKSINIIIDNQLLVHKKLAFHPNTNTATLVISTDDFKKFLTWTRNKLYYLDI